MSFFSYEKLLVGDFLLEKYTSSSRSYFVKYNSPFMDGNLFLIVSLHTIYVNRSWGMIRFIFLIITIFIHDRYLYQCLQRCVQRRGSL